MIDALLRTALPASAVVLAWMAADRALGKRLPARWHYRILVLALALFLVPVWPLASEAADWVSSVSVPSAAPGAPAEPTDLELPEVVILETSPAAVPTRPEPAPAQPAQTAAAQVELRPALLRGLTLLWALGAAAVLGCKLWAWLRFRRRVLELCRPAEDAAALALFEECRARTGLRQKAALLVHPAVKTPLSAGLLHPVVIIPAGMDDPAELRYIFLHELTHIKRRDLWLRLLAMLAAAIHWYDPLVYAMKQGIRRVSEQSCDEAVSAPLTAAQRHAYGSMLLRLAVEGRTYPQEWVAPLSAKDTVERRLISVLHPEHLKGKKRLLALALAALILTCGTAAALAARQPLIAEKNEAAPQVPAEPGGIPGGPAAQTPGPAEEPAAARPEAPELSWPVQAEERLISAPFGGEPLHEGTDIPAPQGTPVLAAAPGTVTETGYSPTTGNYLKLDHGGGWVTLYAHCLSFDVKPGDTVEQGGRIGAVGSTGLSTGAHLHFALLCRGEAQDPAAFWLPQEPPSGTETEAEPQPEETPPEAEPPAVPEAEPDTPPQEGPAAPQEAQPEILQFDGSHWQCIIEDRHISYHANNGDARYSAPPAYRPARLPEGWFLDKISTSPDLSMATWEYKGDGGYIHFYCAYPKSAGIGRQMLSAAEAHDRRQLIIGGREANYWVDHNPYTGAENVLLAWVDADDVLFYFSSSLPLEELKTVAESIAPCGKEVGMYRTGWLPGGCSYYDSYTLADTAVDQYVKDGVILTLTYSTREIGKPKGEGEAVTVRGDDALYWPAEASFRDGESEISNNAPGIRITAITGPGYKEVNTVMWYDEVNETYLRLQGVLDRDTLLRIADGIRKA